MLPLPDVQEAPLPAPHDPARARAALTALACEVRVDGAHLMLVNVPNSFSPGKRSTAVEMYCEEIDQFSRRAGWLHVDGREVIQRAALEGTPVAELFDTSGFLTTRSHELLAQALADEIIAHERELLH